MRVMCQDRMREDKKGFLQFIAYSQVIGIILVVVGNSLYEYPDGCHGSTFLLSRCIYSLHMPTFMFASGFLMMYTVFKEDGNILGFGSFMKKKTKRLLVPFVILTGLTFLPRIAMNSMAEDKIEFSLEMFYKSFLYGEIMPIPFFWFLQASFLLLVTSFLMLMVGTKLKINKKMSSLVICGIYIGLFIWDEAKDVDFFSIGKAIKLGVYFALGMIYACYFKDVNSWLPRDRMTIFMVFLIMWAVLFYMTEYTEYFIFCQLSGVVMVILLSHIISDTKVRIFDHLIGATYIIFLLSWYVNMLTQPVLSHYVSMPWWGYTVLSCVLGIYVPYAVYVWLQNHKQHMYGKLISYGLGH